MATVDINFSSQYCIVRITYETFAGGIKITQLSGRKTSGSRTYNQSAKTVYIGVKGNKATTGYQQKVSLSGYVDFPVQSSFKSWSLSNPIYILGSGSIGVRVRFPDMGNSMSNKTGDTTITAPAYDGPAISWTDVYSDGVGSVHYDGNCGQGTQLVVPRMNVSGYTQVDYVEATGSSHVDIGFKPTSKTRIECAFAYQNYTTQQYLLGNADSDNLTIGFYINGNTSFAWAYQNTSGNWQSLFTCIDTDIHSLTIDSEAGEVRLDGLTKTMGTTRSNTSSRNLSLFGRNTGSNYSRARIYYFELVDNSYIKRQMVPCRRNSDSVYGFYDLIDNVFYTATGGALSGTTTLNSSYAWTIGSASSNYKSGSASVTAGANVSWTLTMRDVIGLTSSTSGSVWTYGSFNLNVLNPDGSEPYTTGEAGTVQFSSNGGSSYTRLYNEPASRYLGNTAFRAKNFEPGAHRTLSSTSGFSGGSGTDNDPWYATQGSSTTLNFYTAWKKYWNDVNVYNPSGVQDYASGYFDLYTSEDDYHRYNLTNEDNDMTHIYNSYFEVSNIRPYYDYYELDHVSGYDSIPTSGTYRKIFDGDSEVLGIYMRYKSYTIIIRKGTGIADITAPNWGWTGNYKTNSLQYGTSLNINVSLQTGYHWKNWTGTFTTTTQNYTFTVSGATDVTANGEANTYTVSYNANGGTGTTASSSHTYNVAKNLTTNGFSRSGYTFLGWSTDSSATTATYSDGQSVTNLTSTNNATVTLYAIWERAAGAVVWVKVSDSWVKGKVWYKNSSGTWVECQTFYTKQNGSWIENKTTP